MRVPGARHSSVIEIALCDAGEVGPDVSNERVTSILKVPSLNNHTQKNGFLDYVAVKNVKTCTAYGPERVSSADDDA
jgi:hypothetical protein